MDWDNNVITQGRDALNEASDKGFVDAVMGFELVEDVDVKSHAELLKVPSKHLNAIKDVKWEDMNGYFEWGKRKFMDLGGKALDWNIWLLTGSIAMSPIYQTASKGVLHGLGVKASQSTQKVYDYLSENVRKISNPDKKTVLELLNEINAGES